MFIKKKKLTRKVREKETVKIKIDGKNSGELKTENNKKNLTLLGFTNFTIDSDFS